MILLYILIIHNNKKNQITKPNQAKTIKPNQTKPTLNSGIIQKYTCHGSSPKFRENRNVFSLY